MRLGPRTLGGYLFTLIWLCLLPLIALSTFLAVNTYRSTQAERAREARDHVANLGLAVDHRLRSRIDGLRVLGASTLLDSPAGLEALRTEAMGFHDSFGGHVVLADMQSRMLFNTRVAPGTPLPALPRPKGRSAVAAVMAAGAPAVGDVFDGPIAGEPLIAAVAPVIRDGRTTLLLINTIEADSFAALLRSSSRPPGWELSLVDSQGRLIGVHGTTGDAGAPMAGDGPMRTFSQRLSMAPWTLTLRVPEQTYAQPVQAAATGLLLALLVAIALSLLGAHLSGRRLTAALVALTATPNPERTGIDDLKEVDAARRSLADAADARERAEATLRDSEARYRTLFEGNPHPMWVYDLETLAFLAVNDAAVSKYGYSATEFLTMTIRDIRPAEDVERLLAAIPAADAGYGGGEIWRHRTKEGRMLHVEITSHTLSFGGRPAELVLAHDVSERERAAAALRESESRFRRAVEQAPFPIVMHVEDGSILCLSRTWTELSGYTAVDLPDLRRWTELAYGDGHERVDEGIQALYDLTERRAEGDFRIRCKHGGVRVWEFSSVGLGRLPDGRRIAISMAADVTERRAAEAELDLHRHRLEEQVALRTAELFEANRHADAANRAKSAFVANMSHEIRTPMNAILGLTHLIRECGVTTEQAQRLRRIDQAGRHLLGIINDILDLSKIEAGRVELHHSQLRLTSLLDNVRSLIDTQARTKGIEVRVDVESPVEWVSGDTTRLQQALLNFASNAVKFTERGQVRIRARCDRMSDSVVMARFEISDTGIGIPSAQLAKLFQPFQQADATTTRRYGGTGLGLAITRRLAQLMGGEAGASSTPGIGSCFWFTARLGCAQAAPQAPVTPAAHPDAAARLREAHAGRRVLLADDNPVNREVAAEVLRSVGLSVDAAEDGQQAVDLAQRNDYALVLMDVQMPHMDGLAATRAIRANPACSHLPVLAMTASVFDEDRAACMDAGMDDFVAKPVDPPALFDTLLRWIEPGASRAADAVMAAIVAQREPGSVSAMGDADDPNCTDDGRHLQGDGTTGVGLAATLPSSSLLALRGLLTCGDVTAIDAVRRLAEPLAKVLGKRLPAFLTLVERFDHHSALELLDRCVAASMPQDSEDTTALH